MKYTTICGATELRKSLPINSWGLLCTSDLFRLFWTL